MNRRANYRDKDKARKTCCEQKRRYHERTGSHTAPNRHQSWTDADLDRVLAHSKPDRELAVEIGRSLKAIQIKRHYLKKEAL